MGNIIEEILIVMSHSRRTQAALVFGVIFFTVIQLLGAHMVNGIQLNGPLAPLIDAIHYVLHGRYEKAAWGALGSFLLLAVKSYFKDRNRLLQ